MNTETDPLRDAMHLEPDPALVRELPVWSSQHVASSLPLEENDVTPFDAGEIPILLPPPPSVSGLATLFDDNPEANELSRQSLRHYREEYEELDDYAYPLRMLRARHTGLPSFLNGYLESGQVPNLLEEPVSVAEAWLFDSVRAEALFGVPAEVARDSLRSRRVVYTRKGTDQDSLLVHARFQQWHQMEWPVFGGGLTVHLATGDPRVSVTNSYFPLPADTHFSPEIGELEAIELAQQALAGYLHGPEAIGLYWTILRLWLETPDQDKPWRDIEAYVAEKQIYALAALSQSHDGIFNEIAAVAESGHVPDTREEVLALLRPAWEIWRTLNPGDWQIEVVPFADSTRFILPFAGGYYLAYQVAFVSPASDQAWRVFVDAQTRQIMGQPESLLAHNLVHYPTAAALAAGAAPTPAPVPGVVLDAAVDRFMRFEFHSDQGGGPVDLVAIGAKSGAQTGPIEREAVNVAFHANKVYEHFIGPCGADPATFIGPVGHGLRVLVGQLGPLGNGARNLVMGFLNISSLPKLVTFQTDDGTPLEVLDDGLPKFVFSPSLDPELIYHEIAHGLMWLQNNEPFDQQNGSVPFGRALVEGYANYFARSLAERTDAASALWARAAYREANWHARWSLDRPDRVPGADLLPAPNLYPFNRTDGLAYDVGMVWARALWDIRQELGDADLADQLAFRAYGYAYGWVTSFEAVAEGLINEARLEPAVSDAQLQAIIGIFDSRGILAERGIQALARTSTGRVFVGTDAGLKFSDPAGQNWSGWVDLGQSSRATGVVGLAAHEQQPIIYALTEDAVYERNLGAGGSISEAASWTQLPAWQAEHTPLCLMLAGDTPYVGTGHGVLEYVEANNAWQQWGNVPGTQLDGLALQMADRPVIDAAGAPTIERYAAMVAGILYRRPGNNTVWLNPGQIPGALVTAVAVRGSTVYAGTLEHGIYRRTAADNNWLLFVSPNRIGDSAVLRMAVDGNRLWAGTTSGLYRIALNYDTQNNNPPLPPVELGGEVITCILPQPDPPLAGTAANGLMRRGAGGLWQPVPGTGP